MIRTITLPHQCHCSDYDYKFNPVMATTYQEIEPLFSFRNVPEGGALRCGVEPAVPKVLPMVKRKRHNLIEDILEILFTLNFLLFKRKKPTPKHGLLYGYINQSSIFSSELFI